MSACVFALLSVAFAAPRKVDDPHHDRGDSQGQGPADPGEVTPPAAAAWDVNAAHGPTASLQLELTEATWMSVSVHKERFVTDVLGDIFIGSVGGGPLERITEGAAWDTEAAWSPDGTTIAFVSDRDGNEQLWLYDVAAKTSRKLTDEAEARITDPAWSPDGQWIVARRRTVDTRSIGVTELHRYHAVSGKPHALTSLDAHPHAGEATIGAKSMFYSTRYGRFEYGGDPVAGLWEVVERDLITGKERTAVSGAGSAARPLVHPDGRHLVFISRDRARTLLELVDLETGRRRVLWDGLHHDQLEGFALHGTYPKIDWTSDQKAVLVWAKGKLWRIGLDGSRAEVPFTLKAAWQVHHVARAANPVPDTVTAKLIRWPVEQAGTGALAFSALGALWLREPDGLIRRLSPGTGYSPSWSADGARLAWTGWADCPAEAPLDADCGGRLYLSPAKGLHKAPALKGGLADDSGAPLPAGDLPAGTERLPIHGLLMSPAVSEDGNLVVVLRGRGAEGFTSLNQAGTMEIVALRRVKRGWESEVIGQTALRHNPNRAPRLQLADGRVWWLEDLPAEGRSPGRTALRSIGLHGEAPREHLSFPGADEIVLSPDLRRVAYRQGHQVLVSPLPVGALGLRAEDLPARTLTRITGDWLSFSPDGQSLSYMVGPERFVQPIGALSFAADAKDPTPTGQPIGLVVPRARPTAKVAYVHGTALTMGKGGEEVCEDCTILVDGDRIAAVGSKGAVPAGYTVEDLAGRTLIPGLIDVHAHLHYTASDVLPEQEWRYLTSLDFGVTTVHDPSAGTDLVFTQAERVAAGLMTGPRVLSTGFILYGALDNLGARTPDLEAARAHVQRLKAIGATSVKVYQQSRRDQRQWYAQACRELGMICACEGGGDLWMNLGMVVDGMQAVEHALPVAPLAADVRALYAASRGSFASDPSKATWGTAYTPTLLVAYGGLEGEHYFYQKHDPITAPEAERLVRHYPRRDLDARAWRTHSSAHDGDWNFQAVAADAATMAKEGVLVTLGAHGQLQGLGPHWELWALAGPGAMTPMAALKAATLDGARYLGMEAELGSIEVGKLADFVVLKDDPRVDIHNSTHIDRVIHNGSVWR